MPVGAAANATIGKARLTLKIILKSRALAAREKEEDFIGKRLIFNSNEQKKEKLRGQTEFDKNPQLHAGSIPFDLKKTSYDLRLGLISTRL